MTILSFQEHGGEPDALDPSLTEPAEGWLDLSTGINPISYPVTELDPALWQRLPRRRDMQAMLSAARQYYRVPDHGELVATPGTQMLIERLPTLRDPSRVAIVSPTYAEHALCWQRAEHEVCQIDSLADLPDQADVVIMVSPNNPTGHIADREQIQAIHKRVRAHNGWVIVDEAFCDVMPTRSTVDLVGPGLIVLKSFGKFFGLAGVRLGFAIVDRKLGQQLDQNFGLWRVSGPALEIATRAFRDEAWITATLARLKQDAERLDKLLGLHLIGGTELFRTYHVADARAHQRALLQQGILIRAFDYSDHWVRYGLPGTDDQWARLEAALGRV